MCVWLLKMFLFRAVCEGVAIATHCHTVCRVQVNSSTVTIQEGGVHLELTVVDTPGFGDVVDNSNWSAMVMLNHLVMGTFNSTLCSIPMQ